MMNRTNNPEYLRPNFTIATATPNDAKGIYNVQREAWIETYPNEENTITEDDVRFFIEGEYENLVNEKIYKWQNRIINNEHKIFVAKNSNIVIGFVMQHYHKETDQIRIGALYVLPESQGMGVGHQLIKTAINYIGKDNDIYLNVVAYNDKAINFYKRQGFIETGKDVTYEIPPLPCGKYLPEIEMVRPADKF